MKTTYLLLGSILLIFIIGGFVFLTGVLGLYTMTNRVEKAVINAGWSGFSEVDLDELSRRHIITDEEMRDTYLDKIAAENTVRNYIKENLKLDNSYYATLESFLYLDNHPVSIDDIIIYNPNDLPVIAPNGKTIERTSIYISLRFPMDLPFIGDVYKKVDTIVDTKTFYSNKQR